jgi:hypothetical protein
MDTIEQLDNWVNKKKFNDELERQGEEKSAFEITKDFIMDGVCFAPAVETSTLVISNYGNSTAFLEVLLSEDKQHLVTFNA